MAVLNLKTTPHARIMVGNQSDFESPEFAARIGVIPEGTMFFQTTSQSMYILTLGAAPTRTPSWVKITAV